MAKRRDQKVAYVRINPRLEAEIEARKEEGLMSMNRVIERDLERYYQLLRAARVEGKRVLSPDEQALIADNLNGSIFDAFSIQLLPHHVADGINLEGLDEKWDVDGRALIEKLEAMSPITIAAIVDAAERFWADVGSGEPDKDPRKILD